MACLDHKSQGGILDLWISHLKEIHEKYEKELSQAGTYDEKLNMLIKYNVIE